MSDTSRKALPPNAALWEIAAEEVGVLGTTIHELEHLPSASKMGLSVILPLRVLWVSDSPSALCMSDLGVKESHEQLASAFLRENEGFKQYVEDIRQYPSSAAGSSMPDLGCFTLARHYQLQVTPDDKEEESLGYIISPKWTRSKTAAIHDCSTAPENYIPAANPEAPQKFPKDYSSDRSSSSSEPRSADASLDERGESSLHDPLLSDGSSSRDSGDRTDKGQLSLSSYSAAHSSAVPILYPQTEDEQIVNIALILFANAISLQCVDAKAKWTPVRRVFQTGLEKASFEARTDGFLCGQDNKSVEAIVEVKHRVRSKRQLDVQMQEAAQMVSWIIADGLLEPKNRCYLLVSQNRHEVYLTIADYDAGYIKYLKGESKDVEGKDAETQSFLTMRSFGPWNIYRPTHMENLAHILLAFTIKVSQPPAA